MAGRPGRPPSGLFRSNPSPAATGTEGATRRLFPRLRWRVGRAARGGGRVVRVRRRRFVGCSRTSCAPTPEVGPVYSTLDPPAVGRSARTCANPQHHPRRLRPCATGKPAFPATKRNAALRSTPSNLSRRKSRRVPPSWPVAAGEGFERKRPEGGRPGRPAVSAETGCRIGNPRSKPDPPRRK